MWVEGVGSRLFRFEKGYCGSVFSGSRGIGLLGFGPVLIVGYTSGSKGVGWPCFGLILVLDSYQFDSCFNGTLGRFENLKKSLVLFIARHIPPYISHIPVHAVVNISRKLSHTL